jgi:cellulose synthase/poly-beta-1,6-N-acetylglucosamine synthase-like glycosyltransferase
MTRLLGPSFLLLSIIIETILLWRCVRAIRLTKQAQNAPRSRDAEPLPFLVILLPAFREQAVVERTLARFRRMRYAPEDAVRIIVITAARERHLFANEPTTGDLLDRHLARAPDPRMLHLCDPAPSGTKASQMNYALRALGSSCDTTRTYIGVYDFDSVPDEDTLRRVGEVALNEQWPDVIQQVPLPLLNLNDLPSSLAGDVLRVEGLTHLVRCFGIEQYRLLTTCRHTTGYCMGAGLFIRLDTLLSVGGFPQPCDDITLGYQLSALGKRFRAVPVFNTVEVPWRFSQLVQQHVLISRGIISFVDVIAKNRDLLLRRELWSLVVHGLISTFEVSLYPFALLFAAVKTFERGWTWATAFVALCIIPLANLAIPAVACRGVRLPCTPPRLSPRLFAIAPLRRFWRTFGFWLLLARLTYRRQRLYTKTDRSQPL